ncbi:MAG: ATP-binding protein [Bacteroidales bacterium]
MDKKILRLVIIEQSKIFKSQKDYIKREIPSFFFDTKKIVAISGVRRCGKSTLLRQIAEKYPQFYYLNFDDERLLNFDAGDFNNILEIFFELFGTNGVFFFDEIQNVNGWEKFISRLFNENYKIFITGSNAKLLSSELATSLTGRHLTLNLFPFSFREYLSYHNFNLKEFYDTKDKSKIKKYFAQYLEYGGFPEVVKSRNKNELVQLYQDVLIKDLIVRFKIKESKAFRELGLYLLSNISSLVSFNNLQKFLGIKSVTSVKNYIGFLEEAYLLFNVPKFDFSLKKQMINNKKIYAIDSGLYEAVSFKFSPNKGRLLENVVFLELKRRGNEVYYFKDKYECDFLIRHGNKITGAIQVTDSIAFPETRRREIAGLTEAIKKHSVKSALILTDDHEEEFKIGSKKIIVMPVWKWLIE